MSTNNKISTRDQLFKCLENAGYEEKFVKDTVLPSWWVDELADSANGLCTTMGRIAQGLNIHFLELSEGRVKQGFIREAVTPEKNKEIWGMIHVILKLLEDWQKFDEDETIKEEENLIKPPIDQDRYNELKDRRDSCLGHLENNYGTRIRKQQGEIS